jgi:hypothetical protein
MTRKATRTLVKESYVSSSQNETLLGPVKGLKVIMAHIPASRSRKMAATSLKPGHRKYREGLHDEPESGKANAASRSAWPHDETI